MNHTDLSALGPDLYPEVAAMHEERRELLRLAGVNAMAISRGGKDLDPDARRWARQMAAMRPLGRPLGTRLDSGREN